MGSDSTPAEVSDSTEHADRLSETKMVAPMVLRWLRMSAWQGLSVLT